MQHGQPYVPGAAPPYSQYRLPGQLPPTPGEQQQARRVNASDDMGNCAVFDVNACHVVESSGSGSNPDEQIIYPLDLESDSCFASESDCNIETCDVVDMTVGSLNVKLS